MRKNTIAGFTLVEMLVAVAVLSMLLIFVAQLMSNATIVVSQGGKRLDSDNQARLICDRMATDFGGMVRRTDADYLFAKQAGNDTMYFYSSAPAYFDSSISDAAKCPVALVGYRINSNFQLERLSKGLSWDGVPNALPAPSPGSMIFLTYPVGSSTPNSTSTIAGNWASVVGTSPGYSNGTGAEYHVLGDQVYRIEVSFLLTDGTLSSSVISYNGLQNVSAISIALGMLDTASRTPLLQNGQLPTATGNQMVNALPDFVPGTPTLQTWRSSSYLSTSGIAQTSATQLRIYERTFYLNTR